MLKKYSNQISHSLEGSPVSGLAIFYSYFGLTGTQ